MTTSSAGPVAHSWRDELPRSSMLHPATRLLSSLRPSSRALLRSRFRVHVEGNRHVPERGPVILAANHVGIIDGPLLAVFTPRPVHALTKHEMFKGRLGAFLLRAGQIPVERSGSDPGAVKACLRVLRDGGVIGIFPEGSRGDGELHRFHHGAAYLALVTGAPVVPVTFVGTRRPGGHIDSVPPRGSRIHIAFGVPWTVDPVPWPRTRRQVLDASADLMRHMHANLAETLERTGRTLPGPLPRGEHDDDPDTGFVESNQQPGAS